MLRFVCLSGLFWSLTFWNLIFGIDIAYGFPEMVRDGYTQCTACHVSPSGGGILTAYGRELSGDLLSTWSYTNESQFLHSSIGSKLADQGFLFGGDIRGVQTREQTSGQTDGQLFLMQANFQAAYQVEHFTAVVSVGQIENPLGPVVYGNFDATEYYGYFRFTDEIGLRAGRFVPAFGINIPDHTTLIKQGLGFTPTLQFDTVEASLLTEHWTVLASAAQTVDNTSQAQEEQVRTVSVSYAFFDRYRVGASYWSGFGEQIDRHIVDINGILGFTHHFYNMTEFDLDYQSHQNSEFALSQLAYEVYKGVIPYFQYQRQQTNLEDPTTLLSEYGLGAHFYPRPHFEISGEWDRVKSSINWSDSAYLMGHYYF